MIVSLNYLLFPQEGSSLFNYDEQIPEIGAFHNGCSSFCKI